MDVRCKCDDWTAADDDLSAARGIIYGCVCAAELWCAIAVIGRVLWLVLS